MPLQKSFSDLELGIRELFRIIVPGAYGVMLVLILAPDSAAAKFAGKNGGVGLGASFFLGVLGYALRPHERWAPYFFIFEKCRVKLNDEITRVIRTAPAVHEVESALDPPYQVHENSDHVALYKVFLEVKVPEARDRIHYFSSFYYMLIELSLFSLVAAFCLTADYCVVFARATDHRSAAWIAIFMIAVAVATQIALLCGLKGLSTNRSKIWLCSSLLLAAAGLFIASGATLAFNLHQLRVSGWSPNVVPPLLIFVAFAFERLGAKQWKQIIDEQVILVNANAVDLRTMSKKWPY
ncbi:MAG: hypothetical protein WBX38_02150 [Candidatus Sulfotelmatobacter sp.]